MITNITISARLCQCEVCSYQWISIASTIVTHCQNRTCRSREWNGVKVKRAPEKKPKFVLPKVVRVRGGNDDEF